MYTSNNNHNLTHNGAMLAVKLSLMIAEYFYELKFKTFNTIIF